MDEETYNKAIEQREEKISEYSGKLSALIVDMVEDGCSVTEVVGLFECQKMHLHSFIENYSKLSALKDIFGQLSEE